MKNRQQQRFYKEIQDQARAVLDAYGVKMFRAQVAGVYADGKVNLRRETNRRPDGSWPADNEPSARLDPAQKLAVGEYVWCLSYAGHAYVLGRVVKETDRTIQDVMQVLSGKPAADAPNTYPLAPYVMPGTVAAGFPVAGRIFSPGGAAPENLTQLLFDRASNSTYTRTATSATTWSGWVQAADRPYVDARIQLLPDNSKAQAAAPSTYPDGVSLLRRTDGAGGWPGVNTNGTIMTQRRGGSPYTFQLYSDQSTDALYWRSGTAGDGWGAFFQIASHLYVQNSLDARIQLLAANSKAQAAAPSTYPDGVSLAQRTDGAGGWPGSGNGEIITFARGGPAYTLQHFADQSSNDLFWRSGLAGDTWGSFLQVSSRGYAELMANSAEARAKAHTDSKIQNMGNAKLAGANPDSYPSGASYYGGATLANGWPATGRYFGECGPSAAAQWQLLIGTAKTAMYIRYAETATSWSAWKELESHTENVQSVFAGWRIVQTITLRRYSNGMCLLEGAIQNTSGSEKPADALMLTLPPGARPKVNGVWSCPILSGATGAWQTHTKPVRIDAANGEVRAMTATDDLSLINLAPITYHGG